MKNKANVKTAKEVGKKENPKTIEILSEDVDLKIEKSEFINETNEYTNKMLLKKKYEEYAVNYIVDSLRLIVIKKSFSKCVFIILKKNNTERFEKVKLNYEKYEIYKKIITDLLKDKYRSIINSNKNFLKILNNNQNNMFKTGFISNCTYNIIGCEINQEEYYCKKCSYGNICTFCIKNCHQNCQKKFEYRQISSFDCKCGHLKQHNLLKKNRKIQNCYLHEINKLFKDKNENYCCVCLILCLKQEEKKEGSNNLNKLILLSTEENKQSNYSKICNCSDEIHFFNVIKIFQKFNIFDNYKNVLDSLNDNYKKIYLPIQLINIFLNSNFLSNYQRLVEKDLRNSLKKFFGDIIVQDTDIMYSHANNYLTGTNKKENIASLKNLIDEFFPSNNGKRKYQEVKSYELIEFNEKYKDITNYLDKFKLKVFRNYKYLVNDCNFKEIFFPLYYVSNKIINFFDYDKILEVIQYEYENIDDKNLIMDLASIIYNLHIKRDFRLFKNLTTFDFLVTTYKERESYRNLIFKDNIGLNLLEKYSKLKEIILKKDLFSVLNELYKKENYGPEDRKYILKIVIFYLKYFEFEIYELNILINKLWDICTINSHFGKFFVKIFLLISINYNDSVLKFNKNNPNLKKKNFLHFGDEFTEKLSKLICLYYSDLIKREEINKDLYSNENLKLFFYPDNFYKKQILTSSLSSKEFLFIKSNNKFVFDINQNYPKFPFNQNLKERIDEILNEFYCNPLAMAYNVKDLFIKIVSVLNESIYNFPNIKKKANKLSYEILVNFKKNFSNVNYEDDKDYNLNIFSNYIIKSSIDEILTFTLNMNKKKINTIEKIISFYDDEKDEIIKEKIERYNNNIQKFNIFYSEKDLGCVLNFLQIYLIDQKSLKYFCNGKNLVRIFSLIKIYPYEVLNFFCKLFKRVYYYTIYLKNHKIFGLIKDNFLSYLNNMKNESNLKKDWYQLYFHFKIINYVTLLYHRVDFNQFKKIVLEETNLIFNVIKEYINSDSPEKNELIKKIFNSQTENMNNNLIEEISPDIIKKINRKLYAQFFKIVSKNTYFIHLNQTQQILNENNLNLIETALNIFLVTENESPSIKKIISIKKRRVLINMIMFLYFIDKIDKVDEKRNYSFLSHKNFKKIFSQNNKDVSSFMESYSFNKISDLKNSIKSYEKFEYMICISEKIDIFINEIYAVNNYDNDYKNTYDFFIYFTEFIFLIKFIVDKFLIYEKCWNGIINERLYILIDEFVKRKYDMISIIHNTDIFINKLKFKINKIDNQFKNNCIIIGEINKSDTFDNKKLHKYFNDNFQPFLDYYFQHVNYYFRIYKHINISFSTNSLMPNNLYSHFYTKTMIISDKIISNLTNGYDQQFMDIENLAILKNNFEISETKTPSILIWRYFQKCIIKNEDLDYHKFHFFNLLMNQLLFHKTNDTQEIIIKYSENNFFKKYFSFLKQTLQTNTAYSKYYKSDKIHYNSSLSAIEYIRFLRLLSENLNKKFHPIIFNGENYTLKTCFDKNSIFSFLFNYFIDLYKTVHSIKNIYELPDDRYIVLLNILAEFLIEYLQTCQDEETQSKLIKDLDIDKNNILIKYFQSISVDGDVNSNNGLTIIKYLFNTRMESKSLLKYTNKNNLYDFSIIDDKNYNRKGEFYRMNIRSFSRIKLIEILIEFLHAKKEDSPIFNLVEFLKLFNLEYFLQEIKFHFKYITNYILLKRRMKDDVSKLKRTKYVKFFTELFKNDEEFRDSLQLKLCFKIFILVKTIADVQGMKSYKIYFENLNYSCFYKEIYLDKDDDERETQNLYAFLNNIVRKVEISKNGVNSFYYFIRNIKTFYLNHRSKMEFYNSVDRDTTYSKLNSLIQESDYFVYEMICNYNNRNYPQLLTDSYIKIRYKYISFDMKYDYINLIFVIIHQIILMAGYFHSPFESERDYNKINKYHYDQKPNIILAIIQLSILSLILIKWSLFEFPLIFQHNIMKETGKKIIFKNKDTRKNLNFKILEKLLNENTSSSERINLINADVNLWNKFTVAFFSFYNKNLSAVLRCFILTTFYLITNSPLCLVLQVISLVNIFQNLYNIFDAVIMRAKQLLTIYTFNYLVIYIFSWISLLYMSDLFKIDDIYQINKVNIGFLILGL